MDHIFYIKRLKSLLAARGMNDYEQRLMEIRRELSCSTDPEDVAIIALLDLFTEFINPLQRFLNEIKKRMREEVVFSQKTLPKVEALTIEEMFSALTDGVSGEMTDELLRRLRCSAVVRNDLKKSIGNNDFTTFENLIRINDVDYTKIARICAYIMKETALQRTVKDGIVTIDEEDDAHEIAMHYGYMRENFVEYLRGEKYDPETRKEATERMDDIFKIINGHYANQRFREGMIVEGYFYFITFCDYLRELYLAGNLTDTDTELLTYFAKTQSESFPAVKGYFLSYTTGSFLSADFNTVDDSDFARVGHYLSAHIDDIRASRPTVELQYELHLPSKLDIRKEVYDRAVEKNFITILPDGHLQWNSAPSLLDYFCGKLYCDDTVKKDEQSGDLIWSRNSFKRLPAKDLTALFLTAQPVGKYRKNQIDKHTPPMSYEAIDELFIG